MNWLLFYNLLQFLGYFWVFTRLIIYLISNGRMHFSFCSIKFKSRLFFKDLKNSYQVVENPIKICQALSFLEIIHPLIGFTKGDWISPVIQVTNLCVYFLVKIEGLFLLNI